MKKNNLFISGLFFIAVFTACNSGDSGSTNTSTTDNTTVQKTDSNTAGTTSADNNNTSATTSATSSKLPLNKADSAFVMKAAAGGMMEVEAGNIAKQNAQSERVKNFANMMVNDHTKSNQELMNFVSGRGMNLPTTMPTDMQKHLDAMRKMKGKAFDNHYMSMMVGDHRKTVADFEKQANGGGDTELKSWAAKTLPTLKMHMDSATAISKTKM